MRFIILLLAFLICIPSIAGADNRIVGHMTALPSEMLNKPITMPNCSGLIINEWRGPHRNPATVMYLNSICKITMSKFNTYLNKAGLQKKHNKPFHWNMSIIPDGSCYRCMNDMKFRFANRFIRAELYGYTDLTQRWIFTVNSVRTTKFRETFAHELFHAMSMHYGIFNSHHPKDNHIRAERDEYHAVKFTEFLGFRK